MSQNYLFLQKQETKNEDIRYRIFRWISRTFFISTIYIQINIEIIIFRHLIVMVSQMESQQHVQQIKEQQLMLKICFLMFQLEKGF